MFYVVKLKYMKKILFLLFLFNIQCDAQTLSLVFNDSTSSFIENVSPHVLEIVYTSPMHGSKFHNNNRCIILRNDFEIDIQTITDNYEFSIIGGLSGAHQFDISLAQDSKTILLHPVVDFYFGETVEVLTSKKENLEVVFDLVFTIKSSHISPIVTDIDGFFKPSVVPDYEIIINNNPSPLNLFFYLHGTPQKPVNIVNNVGQLIFSEFWLYEGWDWKVNQNNHLSYFDTEFMSWLMMDNFHQVVDTISCVNGYMADKHDFMALENGNYLLLAYDHQIIDLSSVVSGGSSNANVEGLIIQELDQEHNLLFEWRSWDHFSITDNTHLDLTSNSINLIHGNAIDIDFDNNLLISSRNFDEITKIDRLTGDVIWRWGGSQNQFELINDYPFSQQHSIKSLGDNKYLLFDNGNYSAQYIGAENISRALIYELDTISFSATKVWEFTHPDLLFGTSMGSVQMLPNSNVLINWGNIYLSSEFGAVVTEVDTASNEIVFELRTNSGQYIYRAQKFDWFFDDSIVGCMDDSAYNYNSDYIIQNYSCIYNVFSCVQNDAPLFLPEGWSLFGYTCMNSIDLDLAFEEIRDSVIIVKDNLGSAYLPDWDFNGIGVLDFSDGYQIKLNNSIEGFQFCPIQSLTNDLVDNTDVCSLVDVDLDLNEGWNMIGYYCVEPQNVSDALFQINDEVIIVKDYMGSVYLPEWHFNGIGELIHGFGYQIKLDQSITGLNLCPFFSIQE